MNNWNSIWNNPALNFQAWIVVSQESLLTIFKERYQHEGIQLSIYQLNTLNPFKAKVLDRLHLAEHWTAPRKAWLVAQLLSLALLENLLPDVQDGDRASYSSNHVKPMGTCQKLFSGFFPLRGGVPPLSLKSRYFRSQKSPFYPFLCTFKSIFNII